MRDDDARAVWAALSRGLRPEPQMTVSAWADQNRILPATNAEPGRWRTARVPYLKAIMDDLSIGSAVEKVILMKGAQTAGTEAALNFIGYAIDHAPGVILAVWPTIDMVRRNSKTRIEPLLYDTPSLRGKVAHPKAKDSGNTITQKEFPGGSLIMTGANSATGLRSTPARYLILDEVDAFPLDVEEEGDPVELAIQRTVTFRGRRKILLISSPTLVGVSRIDKAYGETDQRRLFSCCRQCGTREPIEWRRVRWPEGKPQAAYLACSECGAITEEAEKPAMLADAVWRPTAEGEPGTRGYHLPALASPFERWGDIAVDFLKKKGSPIDLKTWTNLKLGEAFEDRDTAPLSADTLMDRAEPFGELLPPGVLAITCGVDVQDTWLEGEIVGWGLGEENWSLEHFQIHGDTSLPGPWEALDRRLRRVFAQPRAAGDLSILAAAIDSGGHRTDMVMRFSAERLQRRIWAIKGRGGPVPAWPRRPPKARADSLAPVHIVGVDTIKGTLFSRLRQAERTGPGVSHFPDDRGEEWFHGLTAERAVRKMVRGVGKIEYIKAASARNEPLDCRVYATAALHGLYAAGLSLEDLAARNRDAGPRPPAEELAAARAERSERVRPKVIKSKFMER